MNSVSFQPIPILIDGHDEQGQLVLVDGRLVAVLARLDAEFHEPSNKGRWNLEAGFGPCCFSPRAQTRDDLFESLTEAEAWVQDRLKDQRERFGAA